MHLREFQQKIEAIYFERDSARGLEGTHMWFCEEVGELTRALRRDNREELPGEFADVLAWLSTLASIAGIDLEDVARAKYEKGCPRCEATPCACPHPASSAQAAEPQSSEQPSSGQPSPEQ